MKKGKALGCEIHRLDVSITRRLYQELQQQPGMSEVSGTNGRIIRFLSHQEGRDVYQRDLEREFGITRSTASRVLLLMEQKDLIVRNGVEHDARLKKVTLTEKARKLSASMENCAKSLEANLLQGFEPDELEQFRQYLERMHRNLCSK